MIKELDTVVLTTDLADHGLAIGDVGTAAMVHGNGQGFEVEFMTLEGATLTIASLGAEDVQPVNQTTFPMRGQWRPDRSQPLVEGCTERAEQWRAFRAASRIRRHP